MPVIALLNGDYAGITPVGEAKRHGDLGLGTFEDINGEMLAFDGSVYWVTPDGKAHEAQDSASLSFVAMTNFRSEIEVTIPPGTAFTDLPRIVDASLSTTNAIYALRGEGSFTALVTRALPKQQRPFPPLCEAVKHQPTFSLQDVSGVVVGFRGPPFVTDFSTPGYHLHFLTADKSAGGHVLSFVVATLTLRLQRIDQMIVDYPRDPDFEKIDLSQIATCNS